MMMWRVDEKLPALRSLDAAQISDPDGQPYLVLSDPTQIAPQPLGVSAAGTLALTMLDGEHSCADIQEAYRQQLGTAPPTQDILKLVESLHTALMLEGEAYEQALLACKAAYRDAPARDCRDRYPDVDALRAELQQLLAKGRATPVERVRGLIAPHLDYERGAPCYADAYATLAAAPPADRYVILGTNHGGQSVRPVATTRDFQTTLGRVSTDAEFVRALQSRLGSSLCEEEHEHALEHSIELQLHFVQVILGDRPFQIVPILCSSPPEVLGIEDDPSRAGLDALADALRDQIDRANGTTVVIAAADLSHVGQRFGDSDPTTPEFLASVETADRALLDRLQRREEGQLLADLSETCNATRVCSAGCLYAALRALPDASCRVLGYHQAVNMEAEMHVTCTAAVLG